VVYENALVGKGVSADVIYTIEKGSFAQDVIITSPLDPADYGFPPATTRIQVFTEFYGAPRPDTIVRPIRVEKSASVRRKMVSPDFVDHTIGFGEFVLTPGQASILGKNPARGGGAPVAKQFVNVAGRNLLIESVEYPAVKDGLQSQPASDKPKKGASLLPSKAAKTVLAKLSIPRPGQSSSPGQKIKSMQTAKLASRRSGVVIDYPATIGGVYNNRVFQSGTTYFVSSPVWCNGTTTIQGGAVIKFPNNTATFITINGPVTCTTSGWQPAIFAAADDDSPNVGEPITTAIWSAHTGNINASGYASPALWVLTSYQNYSNLRFQNCREAMRFGAVDNNTLSHSQLINCIKGIYITGSDGDNGYSGSGDSGGCCGDPFEPSGCYLPIIVQNALFSGVQNSVYTDSPFNNGVNFVNVTFDHAGGVSTPTGYGDSSYPYNPFYVQFQNCIFATSSTGGGCGVGIYGDHNGTTQSNPFQTGGLDTHYLLPGSLFRNAGTASIGPLLAQLNARTTYAPQDGDYPDSNPPDLGFHYPIWDSDFDALPDWWELKYFGNLTQTATGNYDGDGLLNIEEYLFGTNPTANDLPGGSPGSIHLHTPLQ